LVGATHHQPFFMWYKNVGTGYFRFVTINAFDRQTDTWTFRSWLYSVLHYMQSHNKKPHFKVQTDVIFIQLNYLSKIGMHCTAVCL